MGNLVIVRAGPNSLHRYWRSGGEPPDFDLFVAAYDPAMVGTDAEGVTHRFVPGHKVRGWQATFRDDPGILDRYGQIALLDDDLETSAGTINRCFALGGQYDLGIWQPSLTWDSYFTYAASLHNPGYTIRFCNVVEMMAPFFRSDILKEALPLFALGLEAGIDLPWGSLVREKGLQCAVADACQVRHSRPVGKQKSANGFVGRDYEDDISRCLELFGMAWPQWITLAGISSGGNEVTNRWVLLAKSLNVIAAWATNNSMSGKAGLRAALVHVRHQAAGSRLWGEDVGNKLARIAGSPPAAFNL